MTTPPTPDPTQEPEPGTPDTGDTPDVDVDVNVDNGDDARGRGRRRRGRGQVTSPRYEADYRRLDQKVNALLVITGINLVLLVLAWIGLIDLAT